MESGNILVISSLFYAVGYDPNVDNAIEIKISGANVPSIVTPLTFSVATTADGTIFVDQGSQTFEII